jgi:hypothetical protein
MKCPFFLPGFNETRIFRTFYNFSNTKFHQHLFSGSLVVPCGVTDMTKLIDAFCNVENVVLKNDDKRRRRRRRRRKRRRRP